MSVAPTDLIAYGTGQQFVVRSYEERRTVALERIADALWGTDDTTGIVQLLNGIEMNGRQK